MTSTGLRAMTSDDIALVTVISAEAGRRFAAVTDPRIAACADDPPFTIDEVQPYVDDHRAWVATAGDDVVGFVIAGIVDDHAHIDEVDVLPSSGRQGHGARLVEEVVRWASASHLHGVTITTFRDVPWNAPWYARLGFRPVPDSDLTPGLRRIRDREDSEGLPRELRVVMRRDVAPT
jgi:GNAT superfamily N-acetyltransferase